MVYKESFDLGDSNSFMVSFGVRSFLVTIPFNKIIRYISSNIHRPH